MTLRTRILGLVALIGAVWSNPARSEEKAPPPAAANPAVTANDDFGLDLYRQLAKENAGKNLFFSPYSMSVALAMTAEGARGETALQMGKTLRFPASLRRAAEATPWDMTALHTGMASLMERFNVKPVPKETRERIVRLRAELKEADDQAKALVKAEKYAEAEREALKAHRLAAELNRLLEQVDQYELRSANALWGEKTYPFRTSYIDTVRTYYRTGSGIFPLDFIGDKEGSRKQINSWVEEQTNNRIKDLLPDGSVTPLTRLVLTNAVYFKGQWSDPFDARATRDEPFLLGDGKKTSVPLMGGHLKKVSYAACNGDGTAFDSPVEIGVDVGEKYDKYYPDKKGFQLLELPYKGGDLAMVVIVPGSEDGLPALEKLLTSANLKAWMGKLQQRATEAYLPRFKLETDYQMKPTLQKLGMVRAFVAPGKADGAQFDGMCESKDPGHKLYITRVLHKAFVEVNEKGTEAAAATAVLLEKKEARETRPFVPMVRADRPFVFLIRDRKTGCVLFLGRVTNPRA
jgi:serine protease inhibitor